MTDLKHPFHEFPVHLFHASKPPVVAADKETRDNALAEGYTPDYQHQEYPKSLNAEVHSSDEQAAAAREGFTYSGPADAPFPRHVSRLCQSADDDPSAPKNTGVISPALAGDAEKAADK